MKPKNNQDKAPKGTDVTIEELNYILDLILNNFMVKAGTKGISKDDIYEPLEKIIFRVTKDTIAMLGRKNLNTVDAKSIEITILKIKTDIARRPGYLVFNPKDRFEEKLLEAVLNARKIPEAKDLLEDDKDTRVGFQAQDSL